MDNSNQKETFHFNEETLKELIISFEDLKSKIVYKEKNIEKTFSSILFKLPIPLFLRKVCIYLSEDDIIKLTQTCSILRKIIYSPIGMKILIRSHKTLVNVNYTQPEIQDNSSNISFSTFINKVPNDNYSGGMSFEGEDTIAQLQTLKSVKEFLTEKVRENEALIVKLKKEIDDMKNHLRIEKQINSKSVNKIQVLETKIKGYETEKNEQNERTKELNTKYTNIISEMEGQIKILKAEKENIQTHKKVLINEVKKLRDDCEKLQKGQTTYIDALKKLKQVFVTSELYQKLSWEATAISGQKIESNQNI